ncbi:MAG: hypothetical protein K1Y36_01625 [Blastocatellia bacterium]|nr:hypothetical protein [Blastocatellia bacterium]
MPGSPGKHTILLRGNPGLGIFLTAGTAIGNRVETIPLMAYLAPGGQRLISNHQHIDSLFY